MNLLVSEIFYSVQGEGPNVGKPAVFLRLGGCNLNCEWCDSRFAITNDQCPRPHPAWRGRAITNDQVIKKIKQYPCKHLVITGGEPLLQQGQLKPLLEKLKGYFIEVETNGSIPLKIAKYIEQINCSPKMKNSGNKPYPLKIRPGKKVVYKFVITSIEGAKTPLPPCQGEPSHLRRELDEINRFLKKYKIPKSSVWLMPEGVGRKVILDRSKWLIKLCKKEGYNFSPRLHIMLYGNKRGV